MDDHVTPLTPEQSDRIQRAGERELAMRARPGGPFYSLVAAIVSVSSDYGAEHPVVAWSVVGTLVLLAVARMRPLKRLEQGDAEALTIVRAISLLMVTTWSAFAGFAIATYGLDVPGVLVIVCSIGLSAGAHIALVVDRTLHTLFMLILGGTVGVAMAFSVNAVGMLLLAAVYIVLVLEQGRVHRARFWEGLANVERLREAYARAEAASLAKSSFLANMSHELRTPIGGIMGVTDMMLDDVLSETAHDRIHLVNSSAGELLSVVDDILNYSKIEAGHVSVQMEAFRLRKTLANMVRVLSWPVRKHVPPRIEVIVSVDHDVPDAVYGDEAKVRQILTNLVGNAFKFTDEGLVGVFVTLSREDQGEVWLDFTVRDTGVGIPEDKQRDIFNSFTQVDGSPSRRFGGTGLGLSISSALVKALGGTLTVESLPGEGSDFTVRLSFPFAAAAGRHPAPTTETDADALSGRSVLVVDRSARVRQLLSSFMTPWGLRVHHAEALESERPAGYDVLVCDEYALPEGADGRAPVIILTTPPGRRSRGVKRATLPKPTEPAELMAALLHVLNTNKPAPTTRTLAEVQPPAPKPMRMPTGKRVLLVDDNAVNRTVAIHMLQKLGCVVSAVADGTSALAMLRGGERFDVIFMDIQMPDMDGFEVTRRVREGLAGDRAVAIIALTAHAMKGDAERCRAAGMDGYLAKPANQERVLEALAALD